MLENLAGIAERHSRNHPSLVLLEHNPELYPGQSLGVTTIKAGEDGPLDPDIAAVIANKVDLRFGVLEKRLHQIDSTTDSISRIREILKDGSNVVHATDHAELIDIALSHLALTAQLRRSDVKLRSGIIVSKMVDFLGVRLDEAIVPVRDIFSQGFDRTYLPIPRTLSTKNKFEEYELKRYNRSVRSEVSGALNRKPRSNAKFGPMVLGVAFSGTINKPSADDENTWIVGNVNNGVLDYTSQKQTMTIATSVRMRRDDCDVFIDDLPMHVESEDDITRLMGRLVNGLGLIDGKKYIYDYDGSLQVVDSRSS